MKDESHYKINHTIVSPNDTPSTPVPAATVLLVRDNNEKIEVFMLKRASRTNFGGAWVFPGGKLDADDGLKDIADICFGLDDQEASKKLDMQEGGIHYWIACIRECFEESGILLAYRANGGLVSDTSEEESKLINQYRNKLLKGEHIFLDMMNALNMQLATDQLAYISHWVTPEIEKKRYDTRFFIAKSPAQEADHDGYEGVDSRWVNPEHALQEMKEGKFPIIMPTIKSLEFVANYKTTNELLELNKKNTYKNIPTIEPKLIIENGKPKLVTN
jgi:8-oxo-dGTP pyrophosphatase MutT (NUDIX family)